MADSPKEPQPDKGLPKDAPSDDAPSKDTSSEDALPKDEGSKGESPNDERSKDEGSKGESPNDKAPNGERTEDEVSKGESPNDERPETELPKSATSEIDPELIKLPRRKSTVRPISALAIIAMCATLILRLLSDLSFSREAETPTPVASIASIGEDFENQFIEVEAIPDRPRALRLIPNRKTTGPVLAPVLGSGGKLWLLLEASPWNETPRTDERYRGRLLRMDDVGFDDPLRARFESVEPVPRPIALSEIRQALQSNTGVVRGASGDEFAVRPDTYVRYKEVAPDTVRILAVSTDPYRDEAGWRLALQEAGIVPADSAALSSTTDSWTFDVRAPGGLAEVQRKLVAARLFAASASEVSVVREGRWSELSVDGDDILLGQARVGFVASEIALGLTPLLHPDAYLLNTTEVPSTYWYVPILVFMLGALGLLFAFGLYRKMR